MSLISRPVRLRSRRGMFFGEWIQEGMGRVRFRKRRARGETFFSAIRGWRLAGRLARVLLFLLGSLAGSAQDHARNESWRWAHHGSEPGRPSGAVIDVAETTGGVWEVQFGESSKLWAGSSPLWRSIGMAFYPPSRRQPDSRTTVSGSCRRWAIEYMPASSAEARRS